MLNHTILCYLMDKFGSDKGIGKHEYTRVYHNLFHNIVNNSINLFELGIGTNNLDIQSSMGIYGRPGASLRAWKEYFPLGNIYSADIDQRILFEEDRIKTFYVDQTNSLEIQKLWNDEQLKNIEFDIMIDDGLHTIDANLIFLQESFYKLKRGGLYIIEDVVVDYLPEFIKRIGNFIHREQISDFDIKIINSSNGFWINDNCMIVFYK